MISLDRAVSKVWSHPRLFFLVLQHHDARTSRIETISQHSMTVVARSIAHEVQDTSLLPHEVQGTCPPVLTYQVQGTRSPAHQSATIFIISSFLQRLWYDSVTLCKFEVETLRASHHVSHYGVSRSNAQVKQACLFYHTEASSEWTRLDDAHNNPRFAKEDMKNH